MNTPPRLATWLLRVTVPESYQTLILEDLADEYQSRPNPRIWYCWQSLRSAIAMADWQW
jgi:hypothetical protein